MGKYTRATGCNMNKLLI